MNTFLVGVFVSKERSLDHYTIVVHSETEKGAIEAAHLYVKSRLGDDDELLENRTYATPTTNSTIVYVDKH